MKDIDFDELDRAVNSLMASANAPAKAAPASTSIATVQTASVTTAPAVAAPVSTQAPAEPEADALVEVPAETVDKTAVKSSVDTAVTVPVSQSLQPTLAPKRSGRFMDMIHTSSNQAPRPAASSREGLTITPRASEAPSAATTTPTTPAPEEPNVPEQMPDPLTLMESTEQTVPVDVQPSTPAAPAMPVEQIESPFLADARVQKRPLNADASVAGDETTATDELAAGETDETATFASEAKDEPPAKPEVPELDRDLVAIESSDAVETTQAVETSVAAAQVAAPQSPLGPSSIAQQYTKQPSTGDQSHAAIYDASDYPQPVTHQAKHKSGWLWVVWVVLLLGVGAGGALLLFNLGIIP